MEISPLKQARINANLSVEEVSRRLNIRKHYIIALEENRLHEMPSLVYARGYIKMYAALLGIPFEPLDTGVEQENSSKKTTLGLSLKTKLCIIFGVSIVITLCLWFYMNNYSHKNTQRVLDHLENLEPINHLLNIQTPENIPQNKEDMLQSIPPVNGSTNELNE